MRVVCSVKYLERLFLHYLLSVVVVVMAGFSFDIHNGEDLLTSANTLIEATKNLVDCAHGTQKKLTLSAFKLHKSMATLVDQAKHWANSAVGKTTQINLLMNAKDVASSITALLIATKESVGKPNDASVRVKLDICAQSVLTSVSSLLLTTKGAHEDDDEEEHIIKSAGLKTEAEYLRISRFIENDAKKLSKLMTSVVPTLPTELSDVNFEILKAIQAIITAASSLIITANETQKELDTTNSCIIPTSDSVGLWSQGLISATQHVASATCLLCESAHSLLQGVINEEKIIVCAKSVYKSLIQMLLACKVKSNPETTQQKSLQSAGTDVKRASEQLVFAVNGYAAQKEQESI